MALFFALVLLIPATATTTAQWPETLLFEGKEYSLHSNPLKPYLADHPDLVPKSTIISSANWRGYIATWEIRNGQLLLVDVLILKPGDEPDEYGITHSKYVSVFDEMFPDREYLHAVWYTGNLIIPNGKLKRYVHLGWASTYKKYLLATVVDGTVTKVWAAKFKDFMKFRESQFEKYRQTEEYARVLDEAREEEGWDGPEAEEFLFERLTQRYLSIEIGRAHV